MSESETGIVNVAGVSEGSTLDKKDINDTVDSWLDASQNISGQNIREEGLDRRVFKSNKTWAEHKGSKSETSNGTLRHLRLTKTKEDEWRPVQQFNESGGLLEKNFSNGTGNTSVCAVQWDWDPDLDTYCIIRASFFFYHDVGNFGHIGRDADGNPVPSDWRTNQFFKFGIAVKRFDSEVGINRYVLGTDGYKGVRRLDNPNGDIFACQQIGLNAGWSRHTAKRGPIRFNYDRRTAMSSTFTLIASGTSGENNHTFDLENNMCAIDMREKGTYAAVLVVRPKKVSRGILVGGGETVENNSGGVGLPVASPHDSNPFPECGFFNMNVQTFRR